MAIHHEEDWVRIAALDDQDQIRFTPAFRELMSDLGWEAKAFVGHLLGLWYDPFEHLLDYTSGEATCSQDQPGQFDRNGLDEPQDVVEYWAVDWSKHGKYHEPPHRAGSGLGLSVAWYRDVLRQAGIAAPAATAPAGVQGKDRVAGRLLSLRVKRVNRGSA